MDWTVNGFDPEGGAYDTIGYNFYVAKAVLSEDTTKDDGDLMLFWVNCGQPDYECAATGTQECTFTSDNRFLCTVNQTDGDEQLFIADQWDVTGTYPQGTTTFFAEGLPTAAYIVMEACDWLHAECSTKSVAVEFQ